MEHHRLAGGVHRRVSLDGDSKPSGFLELPPCGQSLLADQDPARGCPRAVLRDRDHPAVEEQALEVIGLEPVLLGVDRDVERSAAAVREGAGLIHGTAPFPVTVVTV